MGRGRAAFMRRPARTRVGKETHSQEACHGDHQLCLWRGHPIVREGSDASAGAACRTAGHGANRIGHLVSESKKIVHPRQRPCPDCGVKPGEPCGLNTGKALEDIHCTARVTGYPVKGSWTPPQPGSLRDPLTRRDAAGQSPRPDPVTTGVPNSVRNNSAAGPMTPPQASAPSGGDEPKDVFDLGTGLFDPRTKKENRAPAREKAEPTLF